MLKAQSRKKFVVKNLYYGEKYHDMRICKMGRMQHDQDGGEATDIALTKMMEEFVDLSP